MALRPLDGDKSPKTAEPPLSASRFSENCFLGRLKKKKEREVFLQNGLEATEKVLLCLLLLRGFEILARVQCLQCCDLSGGRAVAPPDLRASWGWDVKDSATGVRVPQEPPLSYTLESALTRARTVRFWIISHRRAGGNTCNTNPPPYTPSSVYPLYVILPSALAIFSPLKQVLLFSLFDRSQVCARGCAFV